VEEFVSLLNLLNMSNLKNNIELINKLDPCRNHYKLFLEKDTIHRYCLTNKNLFHINNINHLNKQNSEESKNINFIFIKSNLNLVLNMHYQLSNPYHWVLINKLKSLFSIRKYFYFFLT
jgi:Ni2+-binding GTPase involved in maturation of urease and hydrogenase